MTRGKGGGPKPKFATPEAREEARRASKRKYDLSEKRKLQRRDLKQKNLDKIPLSGILETAWPLEHPLSFTPLHVRRVPHRFGIANPDWRSTISLPRDITCDSSFAEGWRMATGYAGKSNWYREWLDGPLFHPDSVIDRLRIEHHLIPFLSAKQLTSAVSGWCMAKLIDYFVDAYNEVENDAEDAVAVAANDEAAQEARWRTNTTNLIEDLKGFWVDLQRGYIWVEAYTSTSFEVAYNQLTKDSVLVLAREYLWWKYHLIAHLHDDLKSRIYHDWPTRLREVKSGKTRWQTEWRVADDNLQEAIRELWSTIGADSSDSSDSEACSDDSGDMGDCSDDEYESY